LQQLYQTEKVINVAEKFSLGSWCRRLYQRNNGSRISEALHNSRQSNGIPESFAKAIKRDYTICII
jgi:hypothetical protein